MNSLLYLLLALSMLFAPDPGQVGGDSLVVSPTGPYTEIAGALADAREGDTIEVHGGSYAGPIVVAKSVTLQGWDWPVIDGGGAGTVVKITAPGTMLQGFVIRNSGSILDEENSGIAGEAPELLIQNNRLEETLFGIYLRQAHRSVLRDNVITSKDLDVPRRGDPIRVWYSNNVLIENNTVSRGRDVVLWYSEHLTVQNNQISEGRYGLHFMYCDDASIEGNRLVNNSVGAFLMYSRRMHMQLNTIAFNRGPSGYGIGLKDMDDAIVEQNLFLDNRIGAHLDNSPREVDSIGLFDGNIFAYNDIGVHLTPATRHNQFTLNSFLENQEQVAIAGGGQVKDTLWTLHGTGNYWSDYAGYDQGLDGLGDQPYRAERLFENVIDRYPALRLFIFSPSAQAVDFAARAVPLVKPQPKLTDEAPLMNPVFPAGLPALPPPVSQGLGWISAGLLLLGMLLLALPGRLTRRTGNAAVRLQNGGDRLIESNHLRVRYGNVVAIEDISFQVAAGQSVALWGPNGAGKTTVLRSILGLVPFQGEVRVSGIDPSLRGKAARRLIGFVPQELSFHDDLTVRETVRFYASLKRIPDSDPGGTRQTLPATLQAIMERLNLEPHLHKQVAELSGGMKQRLALAIALLADPPILLLDEPTSNLDVRGRDDFLELLSGLKAEGKTLLFSSHRFEEVLRLADRVLVIESGKLVADQPPAKIQGYAGWQISLRLAIPVTALEQAQDVLQQEGFATQPNGKGLWVQVPPGQKGVPIASLVRAGIPVTDFEIEHRNSKEGDDA